MSFIENRFWLLFAWSAIAWLLFPQLSIFNGSLEILMIIMMTMSMFKIDYPKFFWTLQGNAKSVLWISFLRLIILPVVIYYLANLIIPQYSIGFFILAWAPTAIATIFFVDLVKWNKELWLATSIFTNLVVPFTFTWLTYYILWNQIDIDVWWLFVKLLFIIGIPFVLWYVAQKTVPAFIEWTKKYYSALWILLILPMIAWPIASLNEYIVSKGIEEIIILIGLLFILGIVFYLVGRYWWFQKSIENKITSSLSLGFMNISLATVIAFKFFWPEAILAVILYEFPWDLLIIPFHRIVKKIQRD